MRKSVRKFLTPVSSGYDSYCRVDIADDGDRRPGGLGYRDISLKIADCRRYVRLEFFCSDAKSITAARRKHAILQEALDLIREAIDGADGAIIEP